MDARVKPAHDERVALCGPGSAAHRKSYALRCFRGNGRYSSAVAMRKNRRYR